jgi:hypothetical protein
MIATHCGQKLKNIYGEAIYTEDCATKERSALKHVWHCQVCNATFSQKVRVKNTSNTNVTK